MITIPKYKLIRRDGRWFVVEGDNTVAGPYSSYSRARNERDELLANLDIRMDDNSRESGR